MWDIDVNTTALPVLDRFTGNQALVRLSEKLMEWDEAPVTDQEIADALGPGMVSAFRCTQKKLAGRVRKVTGEPSLCHSADVAIRAKSLGYGREVIQAALLHDVVEDTSGSFAQLPAALEEVATQFSEPVAVDVGLLTNRYQLLFQSVAQKVRRNIEPTPRGLEAFRAALDVLWYESDPALVEHFSREFAGVSAFLESGLELADAVQVCKRNRKFTFAKFLELRLYKLYIEDIVRDSVERVKAGRTPVALIVKSVDIIDNVRTSEVSNRSTLDKLVQKAETIIDGMQEGFVDTLPQDLAIPSTVSLLHRIVQIRLVDQIKLRRRAVADNFSETRFVSLVRFLVEEGNRLNEKYNIPKNRCEVTETLENEVRRINQNPITSGEMLAVDVLHSIQAHS